MNLRFDFDHNATTPVDPRVLEHFVAVERVHPASPDSLHAEGRRARTALETARAQAAAALGVPPAWLVFVASGTEANNLAVRGLGDPSLPVLAAELEHASVLGPARQRGLLAWPIDRRGFVTVTPPPQPVGLATLVHAQSELGSVQPVEAAATLAKQLGFPLHVDCAQTLGRLELGPVLAVADSITLSAHKAGGLRGCSLWIVRDGPARARPLLFGGGQEHGLRPGTPSIALAAATALAIELAVGETRARARIMASARDAFVATLGDAGRMLTPAPALPNTALVWFDAVDGRLLLPALDMAGIAASQGSACASGAPEPPRVLRALGLDDQDARRCVRFSFATSTTVERAVEGATRVREVLARLRKRFA